MRGLIADLVLGELAPGDLDREQARHLEECPSCRALLETYRSGWSSLELSPPPELVAGVSRRLPRRKGPSSLRWRVFAWAAAAAASLVFGLGAWHLSRPPSPSAGISVSALTLSPDGAAELRPREVLQDYLRRMDFFLERVEGAGFDSWRELNAAILEDDLQGRGAYLLDSLPPGSPSRNLVQRLHRSLAGLLALGRRRGEAPVSLPASWNPRLEREEVLRLLREVSREEGQ